MAEKLSLRRLTGVSDSECEPELAEARVDELTCEEFEVLRATSEF